MSDMPPSEKLVRDFFAALNTGDLEKLRPFFTANTVWKPMVKNMTSAPEYQGDAIIRDFLKPIREGLFRAGDPKVAITFLVANGNKVAAETDGSGLTLSGKVYDNRYAWFFVTEGSKIVSIHEYLDSLYVTKLGS